MDISAALERVYRSDSVADLAKQIIDAGVTEEQLQALLPGCKVSDVLRVELHNKFRDIRQTGVTFNRFGVRSTYKRKAS